MGEAGTAVAVFIARNFNMGENPTEANGFMAEV